MNERVKRRVDQDSRIEPNSHLASTSHFEDHLAELQKIICDLEGSNLGLSESLQKYDAGVQHLKQCCKLLEVAEKRVELLSGIDAEGNPITEAFEDSTDSLENKARSRSRRRSRAETKSVKNIDSIEPDHDIDDPPTLF